MSIMQQIKDLEAQKQKLLKQAHDEALEKAQKAISELNELGYNYSITEGSGAIKATGKRRTGVKQTVQETIRKSQGMTRADIITALDASDDKSLQQSISNALSTLKKAGDISLDDGTYTAKSKG